MTMYKKVLHKIKLNYIYFAVVNYLYFIYIV